MRYALARTGRVRPQVVVVPLEKVQSVRLRQGPVERWLRLATVHIDTAGRGWQARAVCRDATEADALLWRLTGLARDARVEDGDLPPRDRQSSKPSRSGSVVTSSPGSC